MGDVGFQANTNITSKGGAFVLKEGAPADPSNHDIVALPNDIIDGFTLNNFTGASVNDNDVVTWLVGLSGLPAGSLGIFKRTSAGARSVVAGPGSVVAGKTIRTVTTTGFMLNDSDKVAFVGFFDPDGTCLPVPSGDAAADGKCKGIFVTPNTLHVKTGDSFNIAPGDSREFKNVITVVLNNNNEAMFFAEFDDGLGGTTFGIFSTQRGLLVRKGDEVDGLTLSGTFLNPRLNNNGDILFDNLLPSGHALFTLPSDQTLLTPDDVIVAPGDIIDGRVVKSAGGSDTAGFNDDGVVIMTVIFDDGAGGSDQALVLAEPILDSDGDGIPDDEDACPTSDLSATVVIDGCDSGVENLLDEGGCTISDLIEEIAAGATNHGQFVSGVAQLANDLKKAGVITGQEKGALQSCASQAAIPQ